MDKRRRLRGISVVLFLLAAAMLVLEITGTVDVPAAAPLLLLLMILVVSSRARRSE